MSSRAAPSVRRDPPRVDIVVPRDLDDGTTDEWTRRIVCKRCHLVMTDTEPHGSGSFYHIAKPHQTRAAACSNNGQHFHQDSAEVEPYRRKRDRRKLKRRGIRP